MTADPEAREDRDRTKVPSTLILPGTHSVICSSDAEFMAAAGRALLDNQKGNGE